MSKIVNNKNLVAPESGKIFLLDRFVCNYINEEWLDRNKSLLSQSKELGVHRHILKKINEIDGYRIPLSTLATMCFYKEVKISDFFKLIEAKYGEKINDDFIEKSKKKSG